MKNITFKKIVAILLTTLIMLSACSGKPASTGDEIFDTANSAVNAQLKLFEANGNRVSPGEVTITFLPPVYTENMSREEVNGISEKIREQLIEEQKRQFEKKAKK